MLNCGIIGCGRISPNHILTFQKNPDVTISWACDLDVRKALQCAMTAQIPHTTTRAEDVFNDPSVDFVSILTDHQAHYPLAKQALISGKDVIVEKPFTLQIKHAQELVNLAQTHQRQIICISQHRFDPMINQLRHLVQSEKMGTVLMVNARLLCGRAEEYYTASYWHGMAALDGGSALINQGYHIYDILCSFFGLPQKVHAFAARRLHQSIIETEDTLSAQFQFNNGAIGSLNITSGLVREDWNPSIEIISTQGRINFDLCFPHQTPQIDVEGVDPSAYNPNLGRSEALGINGYYGDLHESQLNDFVQALLQQREPAFQAQEAVNTLSGIQQIYESAIGNGFQWGKIHRTIS